MGWVRANKWKLNPDKTKVLLVNRKAVQGLWNQLVLEGAEGTKVLEGTTGSSSVAAGSGLLSDI